MNTVIIRLKDIAHARSGDKGDHSNIGLIAYSQEGFEFLKEKLTVDLVENYFQKISPRNVIRYALPNLLAFNFILNHVLDGGGSVSLRIDAQGKAFGQALLEMELEIPCALLPLCLRKKTEIT